MKKNPSLHLALCLSFLVISTLWGSPPEALKWFFDAGGGQELLERDKSCSPGVIQGGRWVEDEGRKCLDFDGATAVQVPVNQNIVAGGGLGISVKLRWQGQLPPKTNGGTILFLAGPQRSFHLCATYFGYRPGSGKWVLVPYQLPVDRWVNLGVSYEGTRLRITVDGETVVEKNDADDLGHDGEWLFKDVRMGRFWKDAVWGFKGKMAECRLSFVPAKKLGAISDGERQDWLRKLEPLPDVEGCESSMRSIGGTPTMTVDGKPMPPLTGFFGYLFADYGRKFKPEEQHIQYARALAKAGIRTYHLTFWLPSSAQELRGVEAIAKRILEYQPDALFVLRIVTRPTQRFADAYPDEVCRFEDGAKSYFKRPGVAGGGKKEQPRHSFASRIWERETVEHLKTALATVHQSSYGNRVCAYIIGAGACGQWLQWGDYDWEKHHLDYSPAMERAFRDFVRRKYGGDLARLRSAWQDERITFETVKVPTPEERGVDIPDSCNGLPHKWKDGFGFFRNPKAGHHVKTIDYSLAFAHELDQRVMYFCRALKQLTRERKLVGAFYGGEYSILGYMAEGHVGHHAIMDCPDIDFWVDPWPYENRSPGFPVVRGWATSSLHAHNKAILVECDTRTSVGSTKEQSLRLFGGALTPEGDVWELRRDLARLLTMGGNGYWFDMKLGWYDHPNLLAEMGRISSAAQRNFSLDSRRNSQIALIYDLGSIPYAAEWLNFLTIARQRIMEMDFIGADHDIYDIEDMELVARDPSYRLVIMMNCFAPDAAKRGKIESLKRHGRTILWVTAPGLIKPGEQPSMDPTYIRDMTGIRVAAKDGQHPFLMRTLGNAFLPDLAAGTVAGDFTRPIVSGHGCTPEKPLERLPLALSPKWVVEDEAAVSLAEYQEGGGVGMAARSFKKWNSVYSASPAIPSDVLRAIARKAGVHIYNDQGDIVWHHRSLIGIHAASEGVKRIRLPGNVKVSDFMDGSAVAVDGEGFSVSMKHGETRLFQTLPASAK
ncbi:MAG: hypothetical protein PHV34_05600 [Verrucomicrobiae bacterium]|nr:hypothetical protein [Verrucomicrobiae bacterium]